MYEYATLLRKTKIACHGEIENAFEGRGGEEKGLINLAEYIHMSALSWFSAWLERCPYSLRERREKCRVPTINQ
jgi:hypothetical protein